MKTNAVKQWADKHPEAIVWSPEYGWEHQERVQVMHWHAGHNIPGYLPETDVYRFDTFRDAAEFTMSDIEYYGDVLFDAGRHDEADESSGIQQDLNLDNGPEWDAFVGDLYYWITSYTETDCETDDE